MKSVSICLPYYENHGMLEEQCRRFRELPDDLKQHLELIVVDDGTGAPKRDGGAPSKCQPAAWADIGFPFRLFRILVDVRWNQDAARNIAVEHATHPWLLLTDIDHIPPLSTLISLTRDDHDPSHVYFFHRVTLEKNGAISKYKPHPNSWFMTEAMYDRIGGYDERFAGYYGTDADFRERVKVNAGEPEQLPNILIRVPRDTIPDASTVSYGRKEAMDKELGQMIRRRNLTPGWQLQRLTFPYEQIR